jgi:ABC-type Na+ transport system ATPase subunit NatA
VFALPHHNAARTKEKNGLGIAMVREGEIVTRMLHRFEREGWVTQRREHIEIVNGEALWATASAVQQYRSFQKLTQMGDRQTQARRSELAKTRR